MAVNVNLSTSLTVDEDLSLGLELAANPTIQHKLSIAKTKLGASTTPPAAMAWSDQRALTAGADSLDLAALAGAGGNTSLARNFTGLKVQIVAIETLPGNAGPITFAAAESNGYELFGPDGVLPLPPGSDVLLKFNDNLGDVGASAKAVAITGTGTDGYKIVLVAG